MPVAGVAQFEGNCMPIRAVQEACMEGEKHLGAELLTVVDARRGTLDQAQRQLDHARQIQRAVTSMAGLTPQLQDLSHKYIHLPLWLEEFVFTEASRESCPKAEAAQISPFGSAL